MSSNLRKTAIYLRLRSLSAERVISLSNLRSFVKEKILLTAA